MTDNIKQWIEDEAVANYDYQPDEQDIFAKGLTKGIEIAIGFAEWHTSEDWVEYDGHDRWINPPNGNAVLTTSQLLEKYIQQLDK